MILRTRLALLFAVLGACAVVACGSDSHPPASNNTSSGTVPVGGGGGGGDGGDGGSDGGEGGLTDGGNVCGPVTRTGATLDELLANTAPPPPLGNAITPGTYDLTELDAYDPAAPSPGTTGHTAQSTLVVTASTIEMSSVRGAGEGGAPLEELKGWSYQIVGTKLSLTLVCPTTAPAVSVGYSASGGSLALFFDATHREVYTKR